LYVVLYIAFSLIFLAKKSPGELVDASLGLTVAKRLKKDGGLIPSGRLVILDRSMGFGLAPGAKVYRIEGDAEYIRRNEAKLRGPESDDADDGAIDRRKNPALPAAFSQQDGRDDSKNAGQIIQPEQHRNLLEKSSMTQLA
jgi:hypothetical protein